MILGNILEGTIESLAFGGKGIIRTSLGCVVFVPFTAPGEKVRCKITLLKKNYAEAELLEVLDHSPQRKVPPCPYFGVCGGCQLQHLGYPEQTRYKQGVVQKALERLYPDTQVSVIPADPIWAYRQHITLTLIPSSSGFKMGYIAVDNHSLVEIEECPIFHQPQDPILKKCSLLMHALKAHPQNLGKGRLIKTDAGNYILDLHFKKVPKNASQVLPNFLSPEIQGISVTTPQSTFAYGNFHLELAIENLRFQYHSKAFLQNHLGQSRFLYSHVRDLVKKKNPKILLDLFSGIGITSLLSAPYAHQIYGVEWNQHAVKTAQENGKFHEIKNVQFQAQSVENALPKLLQKKPEMAIVNPPRIGLSRKVTEALASSSLEEIVYISCHPATLVRDLALFQKKEFSLQEAYAIDMFPQTGHVEALVRLQRKPIGDSCN